MSLTYEDTLREITTDAGVLRYHEAGLIDAGPPLLLLHGSGPGVTGWRNFRGVLGAFAEFFRCLILEFPGFGVSDDFGGHPMITALDAVVHTSGPAGERGCRALHLWGVRVTGVCAYRACHRTPTPLLLPMTCSHHPANTHPTCSHCGERIGLFELLWRELEGGTIRASYTVDLEHLGHQPQRLWHPGCLPQDCHPLAA